MIDLTRITPDEANKIEVALLQLHNDVQKTIKCYDAIANDTEFSAETRKTMANNRDWWQEVYDLIYQD